MQRFCLRSSYLPVLVFLFHQTILTSSCDAQKPVAASEASVSWPQFRGSASNPVSHDAAIPTEWSIDKNIEWSMEIAGRGWSSPIVVNDFVFVTSVVSDGESKPPQVGTDYSNAYVAELAQQGLSQEEITEKVNERDFEMPDEVELHYFLHCLRLESGEEVWKVEYHTGKPPGGRHRKNSFASETPVSDGEHVFIYVTNFALMAFSMDGKTVWKTSLPNHKIYMEFGCGSSPIVVDTNVIVLSDNEEESWLAA